MDIVVTSVFINLRLVSLGTSIRMILLDFVLSLAVKYQIMAFFKRTQNLNIGAFKNKHRPY